MPKVNNSVRTSKKVVKKAAKLLRNPSTPKAIKSAAASTLRNRAKK